MGLDQRAYNKLLPKEWFDSIDEEKMKAFKLMYFAMPFMMLGSGLIIGLATLIFERL